MAALGAGTTADDRPVWNGSAWLAGPQGLVPIGGIIMWSGTIATIPVNWHLCDGSVGTPDLRNKFIVGAAADYTGTAMAVFGTTTAQGGGATSHSHADHASAALTHDGIAAFSHASTALAHAGFTPSSHPSTALGHAGFTPSSHPSTALGHAGFTPSSHPSTVHTHGSATGSKATAGTAITWLSSPVSHAALAHDGFAASSHAALAHDGIAAASHAALAHDGFAAYSHGDLAHAGFTPVSHSLVALSHDAVAALDPYFALAFIQRTA